MAPGGEGTFRFSRAVTLSGISASDRGFATRFSMPLAADYLAEDIFIREDRLPLPFILLRHATTGNTLSLTHRDPDGRTIAGDNTGLTLTDARLQYASLGVHDRARPAAGMWFPGSEGSRSYYSGGWALRRHPIAAGVAHRYSADLRATRSVDFAAAVEAEWAYAFAQAAPAVRRADLAKVEAAGIDLLSRSWKKHPDGSAGFPFRIDIPGGAIGEYAMQMGFIGQNLPGANELIRAGLRDRDEPLIAKGEAIVDFWARLAHHARWRPSVSGLARLRNRLRRMAAGLDPAGQWLAAARQAAFYVETWAYAWPVPVVEGDDSADFPAGRDQTGLSLIAVGHSGADNFLACGPFAFFRLYARTGDRHFLDYARFLLHNTKQGMDWDPSRPLGYAFPGLQTEAGTVCSPRGHSLKVWLPGVTVGGLVPMSQLRDVFGSSDVDSLAVLPVEPRPMRVTFRDRRILDILGRIHPRKPALGFAPTVPRR